MFKLVRNSFGAGAILTVAQLGVGSGLGVLDWPLSFSAMRGWGQLLTWVAFIFAVGVAGGAVVGRRALRRPRPVLTIWARIAAAAAAGLGGAAAIPLVWIPVRVTAPTVDLRAEVAMAVTAGVGVLTGTVLAVAALTWRPVTAGIAATGVTIWLFALGSVGLAARDHARVVPPLGVIDAPQLSDPHAWWFGSYLMVGVAALLGFGVAAVAAWKGTSWLGICLSGTAGPGLVASAYLTTGWGVSGNGEEVGPYVASLLSVGAGLLAAMAVASATVPHRPAARPAPTPPRPPRALASLPAPLAITAYAEPAYILESSPVEPAYRRQPAFYTERIYLPEPRGHSGQAPAARPEPAARPDLNRRAEPAPEATYEPPYEVPYVSRYDPKNPPQSAPATQAAAYEPGHAVPVEAVVVEPAPVAKAPVVAEPVVAEPVVAAAVVEDAVLVEPVPVQSAAPAAPQPVVEPAPTAPAAATGGSPAGPGGKRKGREKDKQRRPSGRRGRRPDSEGTSQGLRKGERDHIDWIDNLVKLPADPTLKISKER